MGFFERLNFGSGIFWGFVGIPRDFFGLDLYLHSIILITQEMQSGLPLSTPFPPFNIHCNYFLVMILYTQANEKHYPRNTGPCTYVIHVHT